MNAYVHVLSKVHICTKDVSVFSSAQIKIGNYSSVAFLNMTCAFCVQPSIAIGILAHSVVSALVVKALAGQI